jgi:tetratricopeptide (TPR) repeat protein
MEEQWNTIEGLMNERPDSALTLLQAIDPKPLSRGDRAHHALLLSQALDKNYIDLTNDSIITVAVDYYKAYGPQEKLGMALFYLSRVRENAGAIEEAIQYSIEAQQSLAHSNDYNMRALIYGNRADLYKLQYRFDEAIELDRQAIDLYRKSGNYSNIINTHPSICHFPIGYRLFFDIFR